MFALVDCNSFYASCEQIFRPDLRDKPVVVLSNNDGCIVARSKEAKALNIPSFEPYFKHKAYLEQQKVTVFSSNYELYGDISRRVMQTLSRFTPHIEVYSIDEAFLDLSGFRDLREHGLDIKKTLWREQRMPVCVGIAQSKTLAKLANHIAKKSKRLDGVCVIDDIESWSKVFSKIAIKDIWGIGSKLSQRLNALHIYSVQDLRNQDPQYLKQQFSIDLARIVKELNGEVCLSLELQPPPKQQILCSRTFGKRVTDKGQLLEAIADYASRAAEKLRKQKSLCQRVYLMMQTSNFAEKSYFNSLSKALAYPTNDVRMIIEAANLLADHLYLAGFEYSKVGVGLLDLCSGSYQQQDLFGIAQSEQSKALMAVCDQINERYGAGTTFIAQQGIAREWQMLRSMQSPCYTTRLKDFPIVKI